MLLYIVGWLMEAWRKQRATPTEAEMPEIPWKVVEERIKGVREDTLVQIHYLSLENPPADYVLWEGPENIPNLYN